VKGNKQRKGLCHQKGEKKKTRLKKNGEHFLVHKLAQQKRALVKRIRAAKSGGRRRPKGQGKLKWGGGDICLRGAHKKEGAERECGYNRRRKWGGGPGQGQPHLLARVPQKRKLE